MPLVFAGIDEAGYGPTLGPLCVALAVFRVERWSLGQPAPNLWQLLNAAVAHAASGARHRIPIADSKRLKLPNDSAVRHPLIHLERGVLAMLGCMGLKPDSDAALLASLDAAHSDEPWWQGPPIALPLARTAAQRDIDAALLASTMERAGVSLLALRCRVMGVAEFNDIVARTGSKAEATAAAVGGLLAPLPLRHADEPLRIVCDQLGGRTQYDDLLGRWFPALRAAPICESESRSRYRLDATDDKPPASATPDVPTDATSLANHPRRAIHFMPEAESAHLPVALASMAAKLVRELAMMRFNRYWSSRVPDLKPTAGYAQDARRWLRDTRDAIDDADRDALVRRA